MTNFKSPKVNVNLSCKELYIKLSNLNNLKKILPKEITDFDSTEDSCSFTMGRMPKIDLYISHKEPFSIISLQTKESGIPFCLTCRIKKNKETSSAILELNIELNMMMKMMLEKPLTNFLNMTAERLSKL